MRSIEKYLVREYGKQPEDQQKPTSTKERSQPELEVQLKIQKHCRALGWYVFRVEAKASFSESSGIAYSQTQSGVSDLIAVLPCGTHGAIEVKAPGRLSSLRDNQRAHLENVIRLGGFACVVDSVERLSFVLDAWLNSNRDKSVLFGLLPPEPKRRGGSIDDLFES